jgi:hypothetical protein
MAQVQLASIAVDSRVRDEARPNEKTPWCDSIVKFTACIPARPDDPSQIYLERHRMIQEANAGTKHWPENIARFAKDEMKAALDAIDQAEMRSYTIVYHYCSEAAARRMCESGCGLEAGLTVTTLSPTDLNWQKHAGGKFKETASEALWGASWRDKHVDELQAVLIMGVPSSVVADGMATSISKQMTIPESLLMPDDSSTGTALVYSNAFVRKSYVLESVPSSSAKPMGEPIPLDADGVDEKAAGTESIASMDGGEVSKEEALAFFRSNSYTVDTSWLDGAWSILDVDSNGIIDRSAFLLLVVQAKKQSSLPSPRKRTRSTTPPRKPNKQTLSRTPPILPRQKNVAKATKTPQLEQRQLRDPPPLLSQPPQDRSGPGPIRVPRRQASPDGGVTTAVSSGARTALPLDLKRLALTQTRPMAP